MSSVPDAAQILCRQCNAPLSVEQGTQFVTCEFCGTTNFVDKGRAVFHYAVRTTVRENDALAALRRWMAGNKTVKDLDKKAQIDRPIFEYFPMWLVRVVQNGQEKVLLEPAAALSVSELKDIVLPAGDLEPYDHNLDSTAMAVTVPYEAMLHWLEDDDGVQQGQIKEVSLVHLPVYQFKYTFGDRRFTAMVDAASSKVFANIYPSKWETPYFAIGAAAFAAYCCAALIPLGGFLTYEGTGLLVGILAYIVIAIIVAIPIFIAASVISAKV
jgi:LSD1 subclass zinc finger protein